MRTIKLFEKVAIAAIAILIGCVFFTACDSDNKKTNTEKNAPVKVYRKVKTEEIRDMLAKSKGKKLVLNIYPVKLSDDPKKNDFDLKIYYQDAGMKENLGESINLKDFEMQSTWYVGYLKNKKIAGDKIPYGYYIEIDTAKLNYTEGLGISISPEQERMEYCYLAGNNENGGIKAAINDSAGKCPPLCCTNLYPMMASDSAGKCPPCLPLTLLLEENIKSVIADQYKKLK